MSELPRLVLVVGPTAVGKSGLALRLARDLSAELLNVDSVQLYRGLDIGSAKPSGDEREEIRHHLVDVLDPAEENNVAEFEAMATGVIRDAADRGVPLIAVGGTNLYVRVLVHGIFDAPPPDPALRAEHQRRADEAGVPALHAELAKVDPDLAARVHPNDLVRVSRGLEVWASTGRRLSELQAEHAFSTPNVEAMKIALNRPRPELYERINARVDAMMQRGLLQEYRELAAKSPPDSKALGSLGYRHMGMLERGEVDEEEAVRLLKRDTRRFAKQQIGWLRSERDVHWARSPVPYEALREDVAAFFEGGEPRFEWVDPDASKL